MLNQIETLETDLQKALDPIQRFTALNQLVWALCPIDHERATLLLQQTAQLLDANKGQFDQLACADYQVNQALWRQYQGEYEEGLALAQAVIALPGVSLQSITRCKALEVATICNIRLGKPSDAFAQLTEALSIAVYLGEQRREATLYNLFAILYVNLGEHAKGATYFEKSLQLARKTGDIYSEIRALSNLCMSYKDLGRYQDALTTGLTGLQLARQYQYRPSEMWALRNLANTYVACGDSETAFLYFQQAAQLASESEDDFDQAATMLSMAHAFHQEGKNALAKSYAQLVLEIAESSKQQGFQFEAHELLAALYKAEGDYRKALDHFEAFHRIKEVIFNKETDDQLKQLEVAHRTEAAQQDAEIYHLRYVELQHEIAERERTQKALVQAQKLESLGILAGGVAHDFNNLLVSILGQTELALRKLPTDHPARKNLIKVNEAAEHAASLSLKMLAYSGKGRFEVVRCTLSELFADNQQLWVSASGSHCQLHFDSTAYDPLLEIDRSQIEQLFMNLIMNAAEAEAKAITVRTTCYIICEEGKATNTYFWQYTAQPLTPGRYLLITVADDGIGIAPDLLEKIFDPFFSTKFAGRGLGLAASLGIVRGHQGGITVQSEPGTGTTFQILLPCLSEQTSALPASNNVGERASTSALAKPRTVLVIDDQSSVRETVAETLANYNIHVVAFADGLAGVNYYAAHTQEIDLVLLDLTMIGMNGIQTWQQLRAIEPAVKVVLSSGFDTADVIDRIAEPISVLQKPYHPETLIDLLRQQLN